MYLLSLCFGTCLVLSLILPVAGVTLAKRAQHTYVPGMGFGTAGDKLRRRRAIPGWLVVGAGVLCGAVTYTVLLHSPFDVGPVVVILVVMHIFFTLRASCAQWSGASL